MCWGGGPACPGQEGAGRGGVAAAGSGAGRCTQAGSGPGERSPVVNSKVGYLLELEMKASTRALSLLKACAG